MKDEKELTQIEIGIKKRLRTLKIGIVIHSLTAIGMTLETYFMLGSHGYGVQVFMYVLAGCFTILALDRALDYFKLKSLWEKYGYVLIMKEFFGKKD